MRRVVVTGLGVVSCLGNNQEEVYQSLLNSKSGISFCEEYKEHNLRSHVHGKPNIKLEDHIDRKTIRFMGSGSAYNYIAMKEAIKDSGLEDKENQKPFPESPQAGTSNKKLPRKRKSKNRVCWFFEPGTLG